MVQIVCQSALLPITCLFRNVQYADHADHEDQV
jgi:hypothetical protein